MAVSAFAQSDSTTTEAESTLTVIEELSVSKKKLRKAKDSTKVQNEETVSVENQKAKKPPLHNKKIDAALTGVTTDQTPGKKSKNKISASTTQNCTLAYDIVDEFSGKRKRALKSRLFFGFTPEAYQRFFPDNDYLECEGYLVESDGKMALHLSISIQDKTAKAQFGTIEPGAQIFIRPIKNSTLTLTSFQGASISEEKDKTIYECSFALDKSALKTLKTDEIDTIRIVWSKGYQTYQVYYLDFLKDQFSCFDN